MEEIAVIGLVLSVLSIFFISIFSRRTTVILITVAAMLSLHLMLPPYFQIESGLSIHVGDIFFLPLAVTTVVRLLSMRRIGGLLAWWLVFALYLLACFAHGVTTYGLLGAAAAYRGTFYFSVGILYFATFPFDHRLAQADFKWLGLAGLALTVTALVLWLIPQWRPAEMNQVMWALHQYERNRLLPAQAALFVGLAALTSLPAWMEARGSMLSRAIGLVTLTMALTLFHRTVWVSLAAAMLPILFFSGKSAPRALLLAQTVAIILAVLWLLLIGLDLDILSTSVVSAVEEVTADNNSTLDWRIQGWRILVDQAIAQGPVTVLLGSGFGIGFARTISYQYVTVAPHNFYVELFLTSGVLGVGLYLMACGTAVVRAIRQYRHGANPIDLTLAGALICVLVYGGAYTPQFDGAVLMGLAMSLPHAAAGRPRPA